MDDYRKIHLLSKELIPVFDDLDPEPKKIVLEHIQECDECKILYVSMVDLDESFPTLEYSDEVEIKPLKKLVQFNTGLKLLLIVIRAIILFYIFYSSFSFNGLEFSAAAVVNFFQGTVYLFYLPAAVFLFVFTYTFFNKKWLWISLVVDLFVILLLGKILQLIL